MPDGTVANVTRTVSQAQHPAGVVSSKVGSSEHASPHQIRVLKLVGLGCAACCALRSMVMHVFDNDKEREAGNTPQVRRVGEQKDQLRMPPGKHVRGDVNACFGPRHACFGPQNTLPVRYAGVGRKRTAPPEASGMRPPGIRLRIAGATQCSENRITSSICHAGCAGSAPARFAMHLQPPPTLARSPQLFAHERQAGHLEGAPAMGLFRSFTL